MPRFRRTLPAAIRLSGAGGYERSAPPGRRGRIRSVRLAQPHAVPQAFRRLPLPEFKDIIRNGTDFRVRDVPRRHADPASDAGPVYGKTSDRELEAIYQYLRVIPMINLRPHFCKAPPQ